MATFGYVVIDKMGKEKKGSIEAESQEKAEQELRAQGFIPVEMTGQSLLTRDIDIDIGGKVTDRDLSVFCRQFVSMTRAGVSILESLRLLKEQTENKKFQKALREVQASVEKGEPLSESFKEHPKIFSNLMITTIAAGESAGNLDVSFERMASQYEKAAKTKSLVKKAMIYPMMIAIVAVIVVVIMLTFVIPNFVDMFDDMDMELPGITKAVMAASDFLIRFWYLLLPAVIAIATGIKYFSKTLTGQFLFAQIGLKMPLFKKLIVKSASSQLGRTLSNLLASGVPLVEAVEITANTMENILFKTALMDARDEVTRGVPLSQPLETCGLFPPMVYHMVRIGEEAGSTEDMLEKLADYYDEEVEMETQTLMAAMEPLIIVVMAVIVGVLIGAVMAPMMAMYQGLDNL